MASKEEKKDKKSGSAAEGFLKSIGNMIPGLGGLLKNLEGTPGYKEKLEQVDKELERRMKGTPLKRTGGRGTRGPGGIPPGVRGSSFSGKPFVKRSPETAPSSPPVPQQRPADIFDEEDHIKVIAEVPGVEEGDIRTDLKDNVLIIDVDIPDHKYHQEVKLPCAPKGKLEKAYKNGILEVRIKK